MVNIKSKKIYSLLIVAFVATTIISCKKYLQEDPITSYSPAIAFANVDNAFKSLMAVYNQISGEQGMGKVLSMYYMVDNDEMSGPDYNNGVDESDRRSVAHFTANSLNKEIAAPYNQMYAGIERANNCVKYIPTMSQYSSGTISEQAALKRMYGEALTLRAQFYFSLILNWGDVPAQWVPSADIVNPFIPKTDRDTIYEHLLADLKVAEDIVPWRTQVTMDERITKGAVKALRARIALHRGGYSLRRTGTMQRGSNYLTYYQIAYDECKSIIDSGYHHLNPSFQSVFKDNIDAHLIEPSGEVIFEIGMAGQDASTSSRMGNYDGPKWSNPLANKSYGGGVFCLPTYFYAFDSMDTRRDVTCAPFATDFAGILKPTVINKIADGKFRAIWISNPAATSTTKINYDVNWPLIRYSDVLLMFAEADNEINHAPSSNAINVYEQVRKRAFGANASMIGTTPTDHDGFFTAIVNERSFELGGEGLRKYDLIRWNMLATKIADARLKMQTIMTGVSPYPPYDSIPQSIMYQTGSTDLILPSNFSYYHKTPKSTPAGFAKTTWLGPVGTFIQTSNLYAYYAKGFVANHSELYPIHQTIITSNYNLQQDYGY